jgi:hypothetical protein
MPPSPELNSSTFALANRVRKVPKNSPLTRLHILAQLLTTFEFHDPSSNKVQSLIGRTIRAMKDIKREILGTDRIWPAVLIVDTFLWENFQDKVFLRSNSPGNGLQFHQCVRATPWGNMEMGSTASILLHLKEGFNGFPKDIDLSVII